MLSEGEPFEPAGGSRSIGVEDIVLLFGRCPRASSWAGMKRVGSDEAQRPFVAIQSSLSCVEAPVAESINDWVE